MTNKEKFKEVFEKTFGFVPEDCFPCPEKCPEEFVNSSCSDNCPYAYYWKNEYKKPETKSNRSDFLSESAEIMNEFYSILKKHSPIKSNELFASICVFMDVVTNDTFLIDLGGVRRDMAEMFYKSWPHSVEYYERKGKKKE